MSRLYNPFMPSLSFASGLLRDTSGGGDSGGGNDDNNSTTVKSGQTLSEIAEDNNMSVQELAQQNNITDVDNIQAGQTLDLSGANSGSSTYNNGVGLGGAGSNNDDDDDDNNNASASSSYYNMDMGEAGRPGNTGSTTGSSVGSTYDEIPSSATANSATAAGVGSLDAAQQSSFGNNAASSSTSNTGSTYDEIPSITTATAAPAAGTGSLDAAQSSLIGSQYQKQKTVLDNMANGTYDEVPATITSGQDIAELQADKAGVGSLDAAQQSGFGSNATLSSAENDGSTYDDGPINGMNDNAESASSNLNTGTGSLDAAEESSELNAAENAGSTYDDGAINAMNDQAENDGSTYDEAGLAVGGSKGTRDDAVDKILVEKYGWTMGEDGDALSPQMLASQNAAENAGSTYDDGAVEAMNNNAENAGSTYDDGVVEAINNQAENDGSTYDDGPIEAMNDQAENDGSTYDDGPIEAMNDQAENDGSTYDEAGLAVGGSKGVRDDAVDKILVEKYGWTVGDDGDAIAPGGSTASDNTGDDVTGGDEVVGGGEVVGGDDEVVGGDDEVVGGDDGNDVVGGDDGDVGSDDGEDVIEVDPDNEFEEGFPVTINGVTYNSQAELDAAFANAGGGDDAGDGDDAGGGDDAGSVVDSTGGAADDATFVDTNQDGKITSLEQEIANLRAQLANLTGESTQTTSGMTREEIISAINSAMKNNSSGYDPLSFMNAFGFAMNPSYFGNTIPTYMSENGVYTRRAVKDKDTGETRYVNVPIANGGGQGIGAYRQNRRRGFGSLV